MLEDLAKLYDEYLGPPGIPWDGLAAKGHALSENGYDPTYMETMLPLFSEFAGVVGSLRPDIRERYRTLKDVEARSALARLMAVVNQAGADVWEATKAGDWDATLSFPALVTEDIVAMVAAYAANGAYLHFDGVMEQAVRQKKLSLEECAAHATSITKIFQTYIDLDRSGDLAQFKEGGRAGQAGLGSPTLLVAAWIALGVTVILGLCYLAHLFIVAAPAQTKLFEWCDQLAREGTLREDSACVQAAASSSKSGNPNLLAPLGDLVAPVAAVLVVGGLIYGLSIVLPMMKGWKAIRSTA